MTDDHGSWIVDRGNDGIDRRSTIDHRRSVVRIGVLASGEGTNLQAILDACARGVVPGQVVVVVSNTPGARALERARVSGVAVVLLDHRAYADRQAFEQHLADVLRTHAVDLVCLAGFLRILSPWFVAQFPGRIMNIHPALLPSFGGRGMYGTHVHEAALTYGVKVSGCTIHFVDDAPDGGPIILQTAVSVLDDDTPSTLAARIAAQEHHLYPEAIRLFAEGRLQVEGRRVRILPTSHESRVTSHVKVQP